MWYARFFIGAWVVIALVSTAQAQTWSPEQLEVWNVANEMVQRFSRGDVEAAYEFIHPDLVWWNTANDVPGNYEAAKHLDTTYWQHARPFLSRDCVPLTIQVYETFAVVNFYCRGLLKPKEGEDPEWSTMRLQFVMKKEGTKWLQVANFLQQQ